MKLNEIRFSNSSKKFLLKCEDKIYERIIKKLDELLVNPFPQDVVRFISKEKIFRVRVGDYRILYKIGSNYLTIIKIDKRGKVYK